MFGSQHSSDDEFATQYLMNADKEQQNIIKSKKKKKVTKCSNVSSLENIDINNLQCMEIIGNELIDLKELEIEKYTTPIKVTPINLDVDDETRTLASPSLISLPSNKLILERTNNAINPTVTPMELDDDDETRSLPSPSLLSLPSNNIILEQTVTSNDAINPTHDLSEHRQVPLKQSNSPLDPTCDLPGPHQNSDRKITILSDVPYTGDVIPLNTRKNKATKDPTKYKRNFNKELRLKGEPYLGYRRDRKAKKGEKFKVKQDVFKPARTMKPTCTSNYCKRSKFRSCGKIEEPKRQHIFDVFWKNLTWEQRKSYVCSHVVTVTKKVTKNINSKRNESREYFLTSDNQRFQVCKTMFLATLGIKDNFVRYWLQKTDCAMPSTSETNTNRKNPKKLTAQNFVIQFLNDLPKMPSHYCRDSSSKYYLEPVFQNVSHLYQTYKQKCEFESKELVGRILFDHIFLKLNLSLFHPKKDLCDFCCSYTVGNVAEVEYRQHIADKERAKLEKKRDKLQAQSKLLHVFTQDVESVKLAPFLQASAIYYKTKLCVHNFTMYNLATKEVMCYLFDETNSNLEASVFASCVIDYLSKILQDNLLPVVLYSDGCCAQNLHKSHQLY